MPKVLIQEWKASESIAGQVRTGFFSEIQEKDRRSSLELFLGSLVLASHLATAGCRRGGKVFWDHLWGLRHGKLVSEVSRMITFSSLLPILQVSPVS